MCQDVLRPSYLDLMIKRSSGELERALENKNPLSTAVFPYLDLTMTNRVLLGLQLELVN